MALNSLSVLLASFARSCSLLTFDDLALRLKVDRSTIHKLGIFVEVGRAAVDDFVTLRTRHAIDTVPGTDSETDDENHFVHCPLHDVCHCKLACEIGRYVNHSFEPNAEFRWVGRSLRLYFLKNLASGTEITVDYGDSYSFVRKTRLAFLQKTGRATPEV